MGYSLRPDRRLQHEVRRVAAERLGGAIEQLGNAIDHPPDTIDLEVVVHDVRKRCKASRGLARLVEPAIGRGEFKTFDRAVRTAANELSTLRDAHAVLGTFDALLASRPDDVVLQEMRRRHATMSVHANRSTGVSGDARLATALAKLIDARAMSQRWKLPRDPDTLESGIAATYRQGRTALRRVRSHPTDHRLHEWRKAVKYLWYQIQLVHDAAPSVLGPLVDELDRLSEDLGDDHDLTVLAELLEADRGGIHTASEVEHVIELARDRQAALRDRAIRSGATIYVETSQAFADRIGRYWRLAVDLGPEPRPDPPATAIGPDQAPVRSLVERERRFLVDEPPAAAVTSNGVELRQGYLASDGQRSIRVRDAGPGGCTLTFKAGTGAERTELEWPIERREFDAAWPHTAGRRIEKTRHRIAAGDHVIELDVFGGDLDGLVIAEVEFTSAEALSAFEPPDWFGRDVTDDSRYNNAALAVAGRPADLD